MRRILYICLFAFIPSIALADDYYYIKPDSPTCGSYNAFAEGGPQAHPERWKVCTPGANLKPWRTVVMDVTSEYAFVCEPLEMVGGAKQIHCSYVAISSLTDSHGKAAIRSDLVKYASTKTMRNVLSMPVN